MRLISPSRGNRDDPVWSPDTSGAPQVGSANTDLRSGSSSISTFTELGGLGAQDGLKNLDQCG